MRIDIWSDIACPWCYIGLTRFDRVLAEFPHADQVSVTLHSFQLDPTLPESYDGTETDYLAKTKRLPEAQVRQMFSHVQAAAATENLTLDFDAIKVAKQGAPAARGAGRRRHRPYRLGPQERLFEPTSPGASRSDLDTLVRRHRRRTRRGRRPRRRLPGP